MKKCMICGRPANQAMVSTIDPGVLCSHCETDRAHQIEDDDMDGISDARQLTILTIDVDE